MFASLKEKLLGLGNKFAGKTDFLEAVCAASALVAAADGDIEDSEVSACLDAIASNKIISEAFPPRQIENTAEKMIARAKGRVGKAGLMKEISEIRSNSEMAEAVVLVALDVADQGGISDAELNVLKKIAAELDVDLQKHL